MALALVGKSEIDDAEVATTVEGRVAGQVMTLAHAVVFRMQ
jgi:hypothetical protein